MLAVFAYADTSTYTTTNSTYVVIVDTTPYTPPEPAPPVWKPPRWVSKPIPATPIEKNNARVEIKHIFSSPCEQRFGITIKNTGLSTKYADIRTILSDTNFDLKDAKIEVKRWTHTLAPARWIKAKKIDEAIYKQKKYQYIGNHRIPANETRYYEVIIRYPVQKYKDGWGGKGLLTLKVDNDEFKDTKHSSWWDNSWSYRQKLSFDASTITETLTNFPVLIHHTTTNVGDHFNFSCDSCSVRYVDIDNTTACDYEIEQWGTGTADGFAFVHVKVPDIQQNSTTDYIWCYYGNASADNNENPENVWTDYLGVWHLGEDSGNTTYDSAGTANGTLMNSPSRVKAQVGYGIYFDYSVEPHQWIDLGACYTQSFSSFSIFAVMKSTTAAAGQTIFARQRNWSSGCFGLYAPREGVSPDHTSEINFYPEYVRGVTNTEDGTFRLITGIYTGAKLLIYINENLDASKNVTGTVGTSSDHTAIGVRTNGTDFWGWHTGTLDEIRFMDTGDISSEYVEATYLSLFDNFVTFGSEETSEAPPAPTRRPNYIIIPQGL